MIIMMTELWYFDNDGEVDEDDNDDDIDDDDDYVYDFDYNYVDDNYGDNDVMVMIIDDNTTIVNSTDNYGTHHSSIHYASIIL